MQNLLRPSTVQKMQSLIQTPGEQVTALFPTVTWPPAPLLAAAYELDSTAFWISAKKSTGVLSTRGIHVPLQEIQHK